MWDDLSFNLRHILTHTYLRMEEITQANRQLIETHCTVTEQLTTFLTISQDIIQEMNILEHQLTKEEQLHDLSQLEQSRILIQQLYLQVCSIAKNLREAMSSKHSKKLYQKDFMSTVETHLETFTRRQTIIIEKGIRIETTCREQKRGLQNFRKLEEEANKIIVQAESLPSEMYPVIGSDANIIDERKDQLTKVKHVLAKLENLISEVKF